MGLLLDAGPASLQNFQSFEIQVSVGPQVLGPVWTQRPELDAGPASLQRVRSFEIHVSVGPQALGPVWVLKSANFRRQAAF
jgi:hypothetical protein